MDTQIKSRKVRTALKLREKWVKHQTKAEIAKAELMAKLSTLNGTQRAEYEKWKYQYAHPVQEPEVSQA